MARATESHYAMFRATIALAWADHELDAGERERILVYIEHNKQLSASQKEQLREEVNRPVRLDEVWPQITDLQDRAHLLNIADVIFWEDGSMCHSEREVYEKIKEAHMATLDVAAIRADIADYRRQLVADATQFEQELAATRGPFGRLMHYLERIMD